MVAGLDGGPVIARQYRRALFAVAWDAAKRGDREAMWPALRELARVVADIRGGV